MNNNPRVMDDCFVVPGTRVPVKEVCDLDGIRAFMEENDEPPLFRFEANFYDAQEGTEDATEADGDCSRRSGPNEKEV